MPGTATKGSVQQRVHRMSVGHDERLVVSSSFFLQLVLLSVQPIQNLNLILHQGQLL